MSLSVTRSPSFHSLPEHLIQKLLDDLNLKDLEAVRNTIEGFPILVGSGADSSNVKKLLQYANGTIVSTSLKEGNVKKNETNVKSWQQRINKDKVKLFMER